MSLIIPFCRKCGNRSLVVAPRQSFTEPVKLYCPDCGSYYDLEDKYSGNLVSWCHT